MRSDILRGVTVGIVLGILKAAITSCGSDSSPVAAPTTTMMAKQTTTAADKVDPDYRVCRFGENGGTYYFTVASASQHNFSACDGGTFDAMTVDDAAKNLTERCALFSVPSLDHYQATVMVYSSSAPADTAAAIARCKTEGGWMN